MSLYDRVVLCEAGEAVGVYKGKKYQVLGYKYGGKVVELAWFSDSTKSFSVRTDHPQLKLDDPNAPAKKPTEPPKLASPDPIDPAKNPYLAKLAAETAKKKAASAAPPPPKPPPPLKAKDKEKVATGVYKGKKYMVLGFKNAGKVVELAWFSDKTKSFFVATSKVEIEGTAVPKSSYSPAQMPKESYYRFSTTLIKGKALKDRGVDVTKVVSPDGRNIGGAKRTNRTGGWRDRIIKKFNQLSGLHAHTFGDQPNKLFATPTTADWEAIKARIEALPNVEAWFHKPKGWSQTALIVKVTPS